MAVTWKRIFSDCVNYFNCTNSIIRRFCSLLGVAAALLPLGNLLLHPVAVLLRLRALGLVLVLLGQSIGRVSRARISCLLVHPGFNF